MLRTRTVLRIAALVPFLLVGCGDDPLVPNVGNGGLTAEIDGQSFVAQFATASILAGQVFVNAGGSDQRAIGFQFPDGATTSYTIGTGNPISVGVTIGTDSWLAGGTVGSGTLNVTVLTTERVEGTFSFIVEPSPGSTGTLSVTNGQFAIAF
ncbi:MAG: DUF6252 family protein [Gemmatimonadota bacterium]